MPAVDQHDSVLRENDAGIGFEVLSNVGVDAVAELHDLRPEILRKCRRARHKCDEGDQYCYGLDPHEGPPRQLTFCGCASPRKPDEVALSDCLRKDSTPLWSVLRCGISIRPMSKSGPGAKSAQMSGLPESGRLDVFRMS